MTVDNSSRGPRYGLQLRPPPLPAEWLAKMEIAFQNKNKPHALILIDQLFATIDRKPEKIGPHSPVSDIYEARIANFLNNIGILYMHQLLDIDQSGLSEHAKIGPNAIKIISQGIRRVQEEIQCGQKNDSSCQY